MSRCRLLFFVLVGLIVKISFETSGKNISVMAGFLFSRSQETEDV